MGLQISDNNLAERVDASARSGDAFNILPSNIYPNTNGATPGQTKAEKVEILDKIEKSMTTNSRQRRTENQAGRKTPSQAKGRESPRPPSSGGGKGPAPQSPKGSKLKRPPRVQIQLGGETLMPTILGKEPAGQRACAVGRKRAPCAKNYGSNEALSSQACTNAGYTRLTALYNKLVQIQSNPMDYSNNKRTISYTHGYRVKYNAAPQRAGDIFDADRQIVPGRVVQFELMEWAFYHLGIPRDTVLKRKTVKSYNGQQEAPDVTQDNYFSTNTAAGARGVIVLSSNSRQAGTAEIAARDKQLEWSDLLYQMAVEARGSYDLSNIKYICRDAIKNVSTQQRIDELRALLTTPPSDNGDMASFDNGHLYPVVGSRNGRGVAYLLTDYPDSFGRRSILRVHTFVHRAQRKWAMCFELV